MFVIISPSKTMNFEYVQSKTSTLPPFLTRASEVAHLMKGQTSAGLEKLLQISKKLAESTAMFYSDWDIQKHHKQGKAAIFTYQGDVYQGLGAANFSEDDLQFAQDHLRILSGLYGIIRPLDKILPYRLEMSTSLAPGEKIDLYDFWKNHITQHLIEAMEKTDTRTLVNLASEEYSKSIDYKLLDASVIQPVFKDFADGKYKVIAYYAKKARGLMSRFIIKNQISDVDELKLFDSDGYYFSEPYSSTTKWVFARG